jgi:hypothetical protein
MPTYKIHVAPKKETPWPPKAHLWPSVEADSTIGAVWKALRQRIPKRGDEVCWARVALSLDEQDRPVSVLQLKFEADLANPLGWRETGIDD